MSSSSSVGVAAGDPSSSASAASPTHPSLTRRRKSSSSQTVASLGHRRSALSPSVIAAQLIKHGKYVVAGAAGIWWLDLVAAVENVLDGPKSWARRMLLAASCLHALTVLIFLYLVLFLPWFRGYVPNYPKWQQSRRLRIIFPLLTTSILLGWSCFTFALSHSGHPTPRGKIRDAIRGALDVNTSASGLGVWASMAGALAATSPPRRCAALLTSATAVFSLTFGLLGLIPSPTVPVRVPRKKTK